MMKIAMPLSMVSSGREVKLIEIRGGMGIRRRLADMGLTPGVKFRVVQNNIVGPSILAVMDSRVVIGRGMALKIMVEEVNSAKD